MKTRVITIGRQFGSGGREIGLRLAEALSVEFYDKQLVTLAAERSGVIPEVFENVDEKAASPWLYAAVDVNGITTYIPTSSNDRLFELQSNLIKEVAAKGDCVIVGRCADYILRNEDIELYNLFVCAPMEIRIARKQAQEKLDENSTKALIKKTDKDRRAYYNYYTNKEWNSPESYDITVNSSRLGITETAILLSKIFAK
jgi:Cytidylate kinase